MSSALLVVGVDVGGGVRVAVAGRVAVGAGTVGVGGTVAVKVNAAVGGIVAVGEPPPFPPLSPHPKDVRTNVPRATAVSIDDEVVISRSS